MKPIKLKLQGLHSYQELQEVDFSKLCERGTFGIFGPTGSGKSTVLDAITLALFGKVERAPRNTQGILNQNSNKIYVSYTFELNSGNGSSRYTVERQFKKTGENTVQSSGCRLLEENQVGQNVLADKVKEVDQGVEDILGLTVDDFTRAVVLPQGKFAEFLSLQGRDRRMMLQRLFNLEAYGDKLQEKVKRRSDAVIQSMEGIEREKQGLGDASETALEHARMSFEKAEEAEGESKGQLDTLQKRLDQYRWIWQNQIELQEVIRDKELLLKKEREITTAETQLNQAEKAESLRHLLVEQEHLEALKNSQMKELAAAQEIFEDMENDLKILQKVFLSLEEEWEEQQPILIKKKTRLEEAKVLEKEIEALMTFTTKLQKNYNICSVEVSDLNTHIKNLKEKMEIRLKDQGEMKIKLKKCTISPERRQQSSLSYNAYREYQDILSLLEEGKKEFSNRNKLYHEAINEYQQAEHIFGAAIDEEKSISENLEEARKRNPGDERELQDHKKVLTMNFYHINEVIRCEKETNDLKEKIMTLRNYLSTAKTALDKTSEEHVGIDIKIKALHEIRIKLELETKEKERENLAGMLVETLKSGEPCPVCGSKEHPEPAQTNQTMKEFNILKQNIAESNKAIDKLAEELHASEKSIYQQQLLIDSLKEKLEQELILLEEKQNYLLLQRNSLPDSWQNLDPEQLKLTYDNENATLEKIEKEITLWKDMKEGLEKLVLEAKDRLNTAKSNRDISINRSQSLQDNIKEVEVKLAGLMNKLEQKEVELNNLRGEIATSEIVNEWKMLGEWDKQFAELKAAIDKTEQELVTLNISLQEKENDLKQKQIEETKLAMGLSQQKSSCEEKQALLYMITNGETAEKLLAETNEQIVALRDSKDKAKLKLENVYEKKASAEKKVTTLNADYANTLNRVEILKDKLGIGLKEQEFETELVARSSLLSKEARRELKESIQQYNKKLEALLEKEVQLNKILEQKTISEDEWLAVQNQLKLCIENHEKVLEEKGAAVRALKDLKAKHLRWRHLEDESCKLQKHGNLLRDLKRVLTGNALVEFMAEEHLLNVARIASARLGELTKNRYTLEVDSEGGFIIRDDANGGFRRPVTSLSGGETFLVSFSLALALSSQIQLRGSYPLEFFFLDEGFGSLDQELLEVVISALERLQMEKLSIGVISHVQEMRNRMARRLIVTPAQVGGEGSKLFMEIG